jgi:hypothetical protein
MGTLKVYRRWYTPTEDGDAVDALPPQFVEGDYNSPAEAAEAMASIGIAGEYAPSGHPDYPGPSTWYSAEPEVWSRITDVMDIRYEVTAHLGDDWTAVERYEVWRLVTGKRDEGAELSLRLSNGKTTEANDD